MKSIRKIIWMMFPFISCSHPSGLNKEGALQMQIRYYDNPNLSDAEEGVFSDLNIWFKNDFIIEEIKTTFINTDTLGITTKKVNTAYYLFMDRKTKSFYNYSSFNDTAKILDKYSQADTAEIRGLGGWSFYKDHDLNIAGTPEVIPDTVIDGITYKRVRFNIRAKDSLSPVIGYMRCDKKGTMFQMDNNLSRKLGCPLVRTDFLASPENPIANSAEIVFLRDSLTKEEQKVFDAWKKNAKQNPVSN